MRQVEYGLQFQSGNQRINLEKESIHDSVIGGKYPTLLIECDVEIEKFLAWAHKTQLPIVIRNIDYPSFEGFHPPRLYLLSHYSAALFEEKLEHSFGEEVSAKTVSKRLILKLTELPVTQKLYEDICRLYPYFPTESQTINNLPHNLIERGITRQRLDYEGLLTPCALLHLADHELTITKKDTDDWGTKIEFTLFGNNTVFASYSLLLSGISQTIITFNYGFNGFPLVARFASPDQDLKLIETRLECFYQLELFIYGVLNHKNLTRLIEEMTKARDALTNKSELYGKSIFT